MSKKIISELEKNLRDENHELRIRLTETEEKLKAICKEEATTIDGNRIGGDTTFETAYRNLIDAMNEGLVNLSDIGIIQYCNRRFTELIAVTPEKAIGTKLSRFFGEQEKSKFEALLKEGRKKKCFGEFKYSDPDGGTRNFYLSFSPLLTNLILGVCVMITDITDLKLAEEKLLKSEKSHRTLFNMLNGFAYCKINYENGLAFDFTFLIVNKAFEELTGLKDVVGKKVSEVIPQIHEIDPELIQLYARVATSGNSESVEIYLKTLKIWFSVSVYSPEKDYFVAVFEVITERKVAEMALRESEELHRITIASISDPVFITTDSGRFIFICPNVLRILGYNNQELEQIGNISGLVGEQLFDMNDLNAHGIIANIERTITDKSGIERIFHLTVSRVDIQGGTILWVFHDVTELKRSDEVQKEIEQSKSEYIERLNEAQKVASIGSWEWNLLTNTVWWSDETYRIFGVSAEDFVPGFEANSQFIHPDDVELYRASFEQCLKSGIPFDIDIRLINYSVNPKFCQAQGTVINDSDGQPVRFVGTIMDISERKCAEVVIQQKNEELLKVNAEKDKFFSIIAHDLRSPLSGFMGLTEVMAEGSDGISSEEFHKMAVVMKNSAANIFRLLGNLLEWSRMQRGVTIFSPRLLLLSSVISDSIFHIIGESNIKDVTLDLNIPEDLFVFADKNMLESIIRNLTSNALKFTPQGGKISVSARLDSGKDVEISITDSGIGMSKEMIENLFRLDINTNRKGTDGEYSTGLGLILCKDFIDKHGGKLQIESEEGKGSTFRFTLPRTQSPESKQTSGEN